MISKQHILIYLYTLLEETQLDNYNDYTFMESQSYRRAIQKLIEKVENHIERTPKEYLEHLIK